MFYRKKKIVSIMIASAIAGMGAVPVSAYAMTRQQAVYIINQRNAYQKIDKQVTQKYNDGINSYKTGNYADCIGNLSINRVAAKYQRTNDYNIAIGDSYYKLGKYTQAIPYLKRAYDTGASNNAIVNVDIGMSFYKLNLYDSAIPFLKKGINANIANANTFWALADSYDKAGNQDEMINILECLISRFPNYKKDAYTALASDYMNKGLIKHGLSISLKGIQYFPNDADILYWVGHAYYLDGKFDKAIPYLEKSNEILQNNIDTLYDLGSSYMNLGRLDEASACVDSMMVINKSHIKTQELFKAVSQKAAQKQAEQQIQIDMINQSMQASQEAASIGTEQAANIGMAV